MLPQYENPQKKKEKSLIYEKKGGKTAFLSDSKCIMHKRLDWETLSGLHEACNSLAWLSLQHRTLTALYSIQTNINEYLSNT